MKRIFILLVIAMVATVAFAEQNSLIDREGGLKLLTALGEAEDDFPTLPPILVLTAVGNKEAVKKGMRLIGGHGDWLVKPVSADYIMEKAFELVSNK